MRYVAATASLALLSLALMTGCTTAPPAPAVDQAAISAAIDSLNTAYSGGVAARDTSAMVAFYADDGRVMAPNMPKAEGREAIRAAWAGFFSTPGLELTPTSNTKIVSEAGDMVVDIGSYVFKFTDPSGKAQADTGKYATVFKKVNGEWKIVVDMFNSDMPVPGM